MTRRGLSILVGISGAIIAALTLLLLLVMGSVFADARTANIAGPGVDVFLRTPFPAADGRVVLDIEARGGSRAGIAAVAVRHGATTLDTFEGRGAWWGHSITSGRSRGSDTQQSAFAVPSDLRAGDTLELAIEVDYVVALSSNGRFRNEAKHDVVTMSVDIYSASGRRWAQISRVGLAFGCFLAWFVLVRAIARLYARAGEQDGRHNGELEGIGLLMGFMGGSVLGYWLFAWRILNAIEMQSTLFAVLLMMVWCIGPLGFVYRWWKRRKNRSDLPAARVVAR